MQADAPHGDFGILPYDIWSLLLYRYVAWNEMRFLSCLNDSFHALVRDTYRKRKKLRLQLKIMDIPTPLHIEHLYNCASIAFFKNAVAVLVDPRRCAKIIICNLKGKLCNSFAVEGQCYDICAVGDATVAAAVYNQGVALYDLHGNLQRTLLWPECMGANGLCFNAELCAFYIANTWGY